MLNRFAKSPLGAYYRSPLGVRGQPPSGAYGWLVCTSGIFITSKYVALSDDPNGFDNGRDILENLGGNDWKFTYGIRGAWQGGAKVVYFTHDFDTGPIHDLEVSGVAEGTCPYLDVRISIAKLTEPYVEPDLIDFCYFPARYTPTLTGKFMWHNRNREPGDPYALFDGMVIPFSYHMTEYWHIWGGAGAAVPHVGPGAVFGEVRTKRRRSATCLHEDRGGPCWMANIQNKNGTGFVGDNNWSHKPGFVYTKVPFAAAVSPYSEHTSLIPDYTFFAVDMSNPYYHVDTSTTLSVNEQEVGSTNCFGAGGSWSAMRSWGEQMWDLTEIDHWWEAFLDGWGDAGTPNGIVGDGHMAQVTIKDVQWGQPSQDVEVRLTVQLPTIYTVTGPFHYTLQFRHTWEDVSWPFTGAAGGFWTLLSSTPSGKGSSTIPVGVSVNVSANRTEFPACP